MLGKNENPRVIRLHGPRCRSHDGSNLPRIGRRGQPSLACYQVTVSAYGLTFEVGRYFVDVSIRGEKVPMVREDAEALLVHLQSALERVRGDVRPRRPRVVLTRCQAEILRFVRDHTRTRGTPPGPSEIARHTRSSAANVTQHLGALGLKGCLLRGPLGLEVTPTGEEALADGLRE